LKVLGSYPRAEAPAASTATTPAQT
jgi:hypothetical protein